MSRQARLAKRARRYQKRHFVNLPDYDYDDRLSCWRCGGTGYIDGSEMFEQDPFWYDQDEIYTCDCCHGRGGADDCTYW